jgi:hypothetical protein
VNTPGDAYEEEANHIAETVIRAALPEKSQDVRRRTGTVASVQRVRVSGDAQEQPAPATVEEALRSPGQPLDPETRAFMEPRFGHDFSGVRVHTGAAATQSAWDVNAHAYAVGRDIVFDSRRFAPRTQEGQRLIAHELAHVVQQSSAPPLRIGQHDQSARALDGVRDTATPVRQFSGLAVQRDTKRPSSEESQAMGAAFILPNVGGGFALEQELVRRGILRPVDYDSWGFLGDGYYFAQSSGSGPTYRHYRVLDALWIKNDQGDITGYRVISYLQRSPGSATRSAGPETNAPKNAEAPPASKKQAQTNRPVTPKRRAEQPTPPSATPSPAQQQQAEFDRLPQSVKELLRDGEPLKPENLAQLLRIADKLKQLAPEDLAMYKLLAKKLTADLDAFERSVDFFVQFKAQIKAQADVEKQKQTAGAEPTLEEKLSTTWNQFDEKAFARMDSDQKEALAREVAAKQRNIQLEHMAKHPGETAAGMVEGVVRVDKTAGAIVEDVKEAVDGNKSAYARAAGGVGAYNKFMGAAASIVFIALLFVPGVNLLELAAAGLAVAAASIALSVTEANLRIKAAGEAKSPEEFKSETGKSAAAQVQGVVAAAMIALTLAAKIVARIPLPGRYQNIGSALKVAQAALVDKSGIGAAWRSVKVDLLGKLRASKQGLPEALAEQSRNVAETARAVEGMSGDKFVEQLAAGDPKLADLGISPDQARSIRQLAAAPEGKGIPEQLRQDSLKALQDAPVEAQKKIDQFLKNVDDSIGKVEKSQNQEQLTAAVDDASNRLAGEEQARQAVKSEQAYLKQRLESASGEGQLDARIAEAEAQLNPARQKTIDYQESRAAAGESLKGGPIKGIWNVKERIWLLKRQKAFRGRKILEQPEIVGVKTADGTVKPTTAIAGKGRTPDFVEVRGAKTVGGDLKSAAEIKQSVAGGTKKGPVEAEFRESSKIGQQHKVEGLILDEAQTKGGRLVIKGKNVLTGEIETIEVNPADYSSEVISYEDVFPN